MKNRQTGWARRALWVFAIVANAASLAWFADLLQATDTRTKLDTVAGTAAVQSSQLYGYEDVTLDIIARRAEGIIARFADQSDYAFLSAAQVEIIPETALSQVKVRITHQLPTRLRALHLDGPVRCHHPDEVQPADATANGLISGS